MIRKKISARPVLTGVIRLILTVPYPRIAWSKPLLSMSLRDEVADHLAFVCIGKAAGELAPIPRKDIEKKTIYIR